MPVNPIVTNSLYSFQNLAVGYNEANYSTGTTHLAQNTTLLTVNPNNIDNFTTILGCVPVPQISASSIGTITVSIPYNNNCILNGSSPVILTTINNYTGVTYLSNCVCNGVYSMSVSGGVLTFIILVKNNYPSTTIPANQCYVRYAILSY